MKKVKSSKRISSFTLVELLITLGIVMILVGIATPQVIGYVNRSKVARAQMEMGYLKTYLQTFYNDWGEYPTTLSELRGTVATSVNKASSTTVTGIEGPIDYTEKDLPKDVFYKEIVAAESKSYRYMINTGKNDFVIWSYGPDKDGGTVGSWAGSPEIFTKALLSINKDDILVRP